MLPSAKGGAALRELSSGVVRRLSDHPLAGAAIKRIASIPIPPVTALARDKLTGVSATIQAAKSSASASGLARKLHTSMLKDETLNLTTTYCAAGTLAALANREQHIRVTTALHHVHAAIESACDTSTSPAVKLFWERHGALRRGPALAADLKEVGAWPPAPPSLETTCFVRCVGQAAASDEATGGARLLGHVYARHLLDLAAAPVLAGGSRRALGLSPTSPQRFSFAPPAEAAAPEGNNFSVAAQMEEIMATLNECGPLADEEAVVGECQRALHATANVLTEMGGVGQGITTAMLAAIGLKRLAVGYPAPAGSSTIPTALSTMAAKAIPPALSAAMAAAAPAAATTKEEAKAAAVSKMVAAVKKKPVVAASPAAAPARPAARPRTVWDVQREGEVREAQLDAIALDVDRMAPDELRACAAAVTGAFPPNAGSAPLVAGLTGLADAIEAHAKAEAAIAKAATDQQRAWILSDSAATNQANLKQYVVELMDDKLRTRDTPGSHKVLTRSVEKSEALAKLEADAKEAAAKAAEGNALQAVASDPLQEPRRYPYCIMPWDSVGLDGGSAEALLARAEKHLADLTSEIDAATKADRALRKGQSDAEKSVASHQQRIAGELIGQLRASHDQALQQELARFRSA